MSETHYRIADAVGRTALFRIGQLWQARFGRELQGHSEVVAWLCTEFGMEATDAENLTLDEVAARLMQASRAELSDTDLAILQNMQPGVTLTAKEIASKLPDTGYDYVRRRLMKTEPLRRLGFIEKQSAGFVIRAYHNV